MSSNPKDISALYLRKNFSLAWPLALNALLMQAMLIIDVLIVSPLGEVALAAMGIATTIIAFFMGLQFALGNGTQLIVGKMFGANNTQGLIQSVYSGLFINLFATLLFFIGINIWSDALISVLTTDVVMGEYVHKYLTIAQYILFFNSITQIITVFLNGQGNTKTPFKIYLIEVPFNAIISYFLVFGISDFDLAGFALDNSFTFEGFGVIGAAYGSLSAICLRLTLLFSHIRSQSLWTSLNIKHMFDVQSVIKHFNEIIPIAANFLVLSVGNTVYQLLFSQLALSSYVAITLVFPWLRIATQLIVAWAQANAITITQAIGQAKLSHIKPIINNSIKLGGILACIVAFALYCLSLGINNIYPKVEQNVLIALATIMPLYVALPLIRTYNTVSGNCLRAIGKSAYVLKIHFITQWLITLPLCAVFILYLELPIFWAFALLPFEEALKAIPLYFMLKKTPKILEDIRHHN
ncbi:MATE family efflux transporter [Pseudocolwellia sp. AS88]|uniref:MATE family efflux transporter n=1 Tax=Pseudocolwellia sp. AS88 TaxID=3063958 RepID=UPI0026ED97AF|nr:MATE family efflux transporter [Pseudocolwellia sp. AS88]MDO7085827.1 MATE family efflux transporter [Pseudocolwellia sp. AS88]